MCWVMRNGESYLNQEHDSICFIVILERGFVANIEFNSALHAGLKA